MDTTFGVFMYKKHAEKEWAKALDKPGLIFYNCAHLAGIAQLVEHDLAKVGVEGPSPFSRSKKERTTLKWFFLFL